MFDSIILNGIIFLFLLILVIAFIYVLYKRNYKRAYSHNTHIYKQTYSHNERTNSFNNLIDGGLNPIATRYKDGIPFSNKYVQTDKDGKPFSLINFYGVLLTQEEIDFVQQIAVPITLEQLPHTYQELFEKVKHLPFRQVEKFNIGPIIKPRALVILALQTIVKHTKQGDTILLVDFGFNNHVQDILYEFCEPLGLNLKFEVYKMILHQEIEPVPNIQRDNVKKHLDIHAESFDDVQMDKYKDREDVIFITYSFTEDEKKFSWKKVDERYKYWVRSIKPKVALVPIGGLLDVENNEVWDYDVPLHPHISVHSILLEVTPVSSADNLNKHYKTRQMSDLEFRMFASYIQIYFSYWMTINHGVVSKGLCNCLSCALEVRMWKKYLDKLEINLNSKKSDKTELDLNKLKSDELDHCISKLSHLLGKSLNILYHGMYTEENMLMRRKLILQDILEGKISGKLDPRNNNYIDYYSHIEKRFIEYKNNGRVFTSRIPYLLTLKEKLLIDNLLTKRLQMNELPVKFEDLKDEYVYRNIYWNKRALHRGQRKLLLTEVLFLSEKLQQGDTILYIGAAPGEHTPFLYELFKKYDPKFVLYDPGDFDDQLVKLQKEFPDRWKLFQQYFEDEDSKFIKENYDKTKLLFVSDIRSRNIANGPDKEKNILLEQYMQEKWAVDIDARSFMFKFRATYFKHYSLESIKHIKGDLYIQPWANEITSEIRLIADSPYTFNYIPNPLFEDKMFYLNSFIREWAMFNHGVDIKKVQGMCHCYDCALEVYIWKLYIQKTDYKGLGSRVKNNSFKETSFRTLSKEISNKETPGKEIENKDVLDAVVELMNITNSNLKMPLEAPKHKDYNSEELIKFHALPPKDKYAREK